MENYHEDKYLFVAIWVEQTVDAQYILVKQ